MSRSQPPPAPNNLSYDFGDLDYGQDHEMPCPQLPMDGMDSSDMMALLNNNPLFGSGFDNFPIWTDPTAGSSFHADFSTSFSTPMSQPMGPMMASGPPSASLHIPQAHIPQKPLARDGPVSQQRPVPPGTTGGTSSSATDFTRRRNWPEKVVEEMRDLLQVLDGDGRIKYVSRSVTGLVGYLPEDVTNLFLKDLIHPDDVGLFVSETNEAIASGGSMRLIYRLKNKDGTYSILESNAALLDTFLEHKVENERLRRRIADLRAEEEADEVDAQSRWGQRRESGADTLLSDDARTRGSNSTPVATGTSAGTGLRGSIDGCMPPPDRPLGTRSGGALTRENLEGAVAGNQPDSLKDKMARYERGSRAETIEMLTGLRYVDGERGSGLTSGRTSPKLITGDAGIMIPIGRELRRGEKKKKQKAVEEYVCTDCGTLESPEWRKGPNGPKTLCNACGLRWAKKEKKKQLMNSDAAPHSSTSGDQPMKG